MSDPISHYEIKLRQARLPLLRDAQARWPDAFDPRFPCKCGQTTIRCRVRSGASGDGWHVAAHCIMCDSNGGKWLSKAVRNPDSTVYPLRSEVMCQSEPADFVCEHCGASPAEEHHWAPRGLFGREAFDWPTSFLCRGCHMRWHDIVTPQIVHRVAS